MCRYVQPLPLAGTSKSLLSALSWMYLAIPVLHVACRKVRAEALTEMWVQVSKREVNRRHVERIRGMANIADPTMDPMDLELLTVLQANPHWTR